MQNLIAMAMSHTQVELPLRYKGKRIKIEVDVYETRPGYHLIAIEGEVVGWVNKGEWETMVRRGYAQGRCEDREIGIQRLYEFWLTH